MALRPLLLGLLFAATLSAPAHARHTKKTRATDYTAYTLNDGEIRAGLYRLGYGITDTIEIGTMNLFWIARIKNFNVKWNFWKKRKGKRQAFNASLMTGYYWGNPRDLSGAMPDIPFSAFPLYAMGSWRKGRWTLSGGFGYTLIQSEASGDVGTGSQSANIAGALSGSTLVLLPSVEWRWGKTTAFVLESRLLVAQKGNVSGATTIPLDPDTELELHGNAGGDFTTKGLRNFSLGAFWSFDAFNLRLGWTFGNVMIPTINAFAEAELGYPDFDLFWRF